MTPTASFYQDHEFSTILIELGNNSAQLTLAEAAEFAEQLMSACTQQALHNEITMFS